MHDWFRQNISSNGGHCDSHDTSTVQPIIARMPVCQNCSSAARRGHKVGRAESCWVSMWWKPKHITLNPPLSSPHPDQEPHSSASAGSHLQTSLKWRKRANYWLDIGGVSNRNKYYVACSCVGVVQHWRTRSSWNEGHLESHITHTGEDRKERIEEGGHLWICRMQTRLFVYGISKINVFINNTKLSY